MRRNREQMYADIVKICSEKNYELVTTYDEFKNSRTKIKYVCPIHGEHEIRADGLLAGQSCIRCAITASLKSRYSNNFHERMTKLYNKAKIACEKKGYFLL